jgi:hypothetical protein
MVDFFYIKTMSTLSLTSINSISVLSEKVIEYTSIGYDELWEKNISDRESKYLEYLDNKVICGLVGLEYIYNKLEDWEYWCGCPLDARFMLRNLAKSEQISEYYRYDGLSAHQMHVMACSVKVSFLMVIKDSVSIVLGSGPFCDNAWLYLNQHHYWIVDGSKVDSLTVRAMEDGSVECRRSKGYKLYNDMVNVLEEESRVSYLFDFDFDLESYSSEEEEYEDEEEYDGEEEEYDAEEEEYDAEEEEYDGEEEEYDEEEE